MNRTLYTDRQGRLKITRRQPKALSNLQIEDTLDQLEEFIQTERTRRERVFKTDPGKRRTKLTQCDKNLKGVQQLRDYIRRLEQQAGVHTTQERLL